MGVLYVQIQNNGSVHNGLSAIWEQGLRRPRIFPGWQNGPAELSWRRRRRTTTTTATTTTTTTTTTRRTPESRLNCNRLETEQLGLQWRLPHFCNDTNRHTDTRMRMCIVGKGSLTVGKRLWKKCKEKNNSYCSVSLIVVQWHFVLILKAF